MYAKTPLGALGLILLGIGLLRGVCCLGGALAFGLAGMVVIFGPGAPLLLAVAPVVAVVLGLICLCSGIVCLVPASRRF